MYISEASKKDCGAIQDLLKRCGNFMTIDKSYFNKWDVALQCRDEDGKLLGFIWCGLMCRGKVGYIDKFATDPDYAHKKLGLGLSRALLHKLRSRKVEKVFGMIRQSEEYHDRSAMNALRSAMGSDTVSYTHVSTNIEKAYKDLEQSRSL